MESKTVDSSNTAPAQPAAPKPAAPPSQNAWAKKPSIVPDASATATVQSQPTQPQKHVSNGQPPYPRKNSQGRGSKRPSNAGMATSGGAPQQSKPITIPASAGPSSRSVSQLKFGVDGPDGSPKPPAAITSYAKVTGKTANAQPPAGKLKFGTVEQAETGSSVSTASSVSQAPANGSINVPPALIGNVAKTSEFDQIERVRTAPPELQDKINSAVTNGPANPPASNQGSTQTSRRNSNAQPVPMNGAAPTFTPGAPAFVPGFQQQPPYMFSGPQGFVRPPHFPAHVPFGQVPPQYVPPYGHPPFIASPAGSAPMSRAASGESMYRPGFVKPNPSRESASSTTNSSDAPLIVTPRKKIAIVIKNPETGENISLPEKTKSTSVADIDKDETNAEEKKKEVKSEDATKTEEQEVKKEVVKQESPTKEVKDAATEKKSPEKAEKEVPKVEVRSKTPSPQKQQPVKPIAEEKEEIIPNGKPAEPKVENEQPLADVKAPEPPKQEEKAARAEEKEDGEITPVKATPDTEESKAFALKDGKRVYEREFLIRYKEECTNKPEDLPSIEIVVGEDNFGLGARKGPLRPPPGLSRGSGRYSEIPMRGRGQKSGSAGSRHSMAPSIKQGSGRRSNRMSQRGSSGGSNEPAIKLVKGANAWKPFSERELEERSSQLEIVKRTAMSLLNKLTLEKFDPITARVLALELTNIQEVECLVDIIFEKAIVETKFAGMYATLCLALAKDLPDFTVEQKDRISPEEKARFQADVKATIFRKAIVLHAQKEFERESEWSNIERPTLTENMTEAEIKEMTEKEAQRKREKSRTLGNMIFIGQLFKNYLISEKIVHFCIQKLLTEPEEEDLESVCSLLVTVGKLIDKPESSAWIKQYMERLQEYSEAKDKFSSKVRFKIVDVIEMRSRKWAERERVQNLNAGPMKLNEVKKVAERQAEKERRQAASSRKSEMFRDSRRPPDFPGRNEPRYSIKPRGSRAEPSRSVESREEFVKAGTKKPSQGSTESQVSRTNSTESLSEKTSSKNMYDALMNMDGQDQDNDDVSAPESEAAEDNTQPGSTVSLNKNIIEALALRNFIDKQMASDLRKAFAASEDDAAPEDKGFGVILELQSFVKTEDEQKTILEGLQKLVEEFAKDAFRGHNSTDKAEKKAVYDLLRNFAKVFSKCLIQFPEMVDDVKSEILQSNLSQLPEIILDIPGYAEVLGTVFGRLVLDCNFDFGYAKNMIAEYAEDFGNFTPSSRMAHIAINPPAYATFFSYAMNAYGSEEEADALKFAWLAFITDEYAKDRESPLSVEEVTIDMVMFPWWGMDSKDLEVLPEGPVARWLADCDLLDRLSPSLVAISVAQEFMFKQLQRNNNEVDFEQVANGVKPFFKTGSVNLQEVNVITRSLLKHIHRAASTKAKPEESGYAEVELNLAKQWFSSVLYPALECSSDKQALQLEVLFCVQEWGNKDVLKKLGRLLETNSTLTTVDNYFDRIFEALHESKCIEKEAFTAWESNSTKLTEWKEETLKRGGAEFLKRLQAAK